MIRDALQNRGRSLDTSALMRQKRVSALLHLCQGLALTALGTPASTPYSMRPGRIECCLPKYSAPQCALQVNIILAN